MKSRSKTLNPNLKICCRVRPYMKGARDMLTINSSTKLTLNDVSKKNAKNAN